MRREEAHASCERVEYWKPCTTVLGIFDGAALLAERGLPLPAWKVPADSWIILAKCPQKKAVRAIGARRDNELCHVIATVLNPHIHFSGEYDRISAQQSYCRTCPHRPGEAHA